MSGRGKAGKGLGAEKASKKQKPAPHEWKDGEEAVIIAHTTPDDSETTIYCIPASILHPLLKPAASGTNPNLYITLGDGDNDVVFEALTATHIKDWRGENAADDEEQEEGQGDGADEIDDKQREAVMEDIAEWVGSLFRFLKAPPVPVRILSHISVYDHS